MDKLSSICRKSYPFIERTLPTLNYLPNTNSAHNKYRMSVKLNKSPSTFDGKDNCGGVCYLLDYFLNKHGYENTLTTTDRGCFTTRETHTYLVNGHFIIDPTYRQMFLPDYSNILNINSFNYNRIMMAKARIAQSLIGKELFF